jgi:hypothetical protein
MHISSWATMTKRHLGRQWHCRTTRTINLDYVSPHGRAAGAQKAVARLRQLYLALRVSTLKDMRGPYRRAEDLSRYEEGLSEPGCPNDHSRPSVPIATRWTNRIHFCAVHESVHGTSATSGDVRFFAVVRGCAEPVDPPRSYVAADPLGQNSPAACLI